MCKQLLFVIIAIIIVYFLCMCKGNHKNEEYTIPPYGCEFKEDCLYDQARWIQLNNGMEGVCLSNGIACPSFSKKYFMGIYTPVAMSYDSKAPYCEMLSDGLSNSIKTSLSNEQFDYYPYGNYTHPRKYREDSTALDLGMYPIN